MRILILSDSCFNDNIIPMYKAMLAKGLDVTCLIDLSRLKVGLFNIKERIDKQAIIPASSYSELKRFEEYVDLGRMFLINHNVDKKHPWRDLTKAITVFRFIRKGNYDVIHCDFLFFRAYYLLYYFREKIVFVQHDPFAHSGHVYNQEIRTAFHMAYKLLPKFVVLNNYHYERYCKEHNLKPSQVFINRLGPLECIRLFANPLIKERKNNVLFFGRIVKYKGVEYLCEAMTKVHEVIPDATCTIAGSGQFYFNIEQYKILPYFEIHNHYIEETDLAVYLQECSVSICAYTDATQSGGVLTSFAMEKPVIASDLETMKEMVREGYNCLLVPPCDADALAAAIINILKDKELRLKIKKNIINENDHGSLSWASIVDNYLDIYRKPLYEKD